MLHVHNYSRGHVSFNKTNGYFRIIKFDNQTILHHLLFLL